MIKPILVVIASLFVLAGCETAPKAKPSSVATPAPHPVAKVTSKLLGKWAVVADTSGRGDTGSMVLGPDGTFTMKYKMPGKPTETCSGTFTEETETVMGAKNQVVSLTIKKDDKGPVSESAVLRLIFDSKNNTLTDYLTVTFVKRK